MIMLKLNIFLSFTAKTYLKPKYFRIFMNERDSCTAFWLGLTLPNTPFPLKNISSQHHPPNCEAPPYSLWSPGHPE